MSFSTSSFLIKFTHLFGENGINERYSDLSDFTIISRDGEQIPTFKLVLAFQGKYFEALFRQGPERRQVQLQFEDCYLRRIFHSPFLTKLDNLGVTELLQMLEIAEYLDMEDLSRQIQNFLGKELNLENIRMSWSKSFKLEGLAESKAWRSEGFRNSVLLWLSGCFRDDRSGCH